MTISPEDLWDTLRRLRMDLTAAQAKLSDAMRYMAALEIPDGGPVKLKLECPTCHQKYPSPIALSEHRYNQHDGPVPEHYLAAERLAGMEAT